MRVLLTCAGVLCLTLAFVPAASASVDPQTLARNTADSVLALLPCLDDLSPDACIPGAHVIERCVDDIDGCLPERVLECPVQDAPSLWCTDLTLP